MTPLTAEIRRLDSRIRRAAVLVQVAEAVAVATRVSREARMLVAKDTRRGS